MNYNFLEKNWKDRVTIPKDFLKFLELASKIKDQPVKFKVYQFLLDPRLYEIAHGRLISNLTPGSNSVTLYGSNMPCIADTIEKLRSETFQFTPVDIAKPSGGARDKVVMEIMKMILEAIFEPRFSHNSHGFRPSHSSHTALKQVRSQFQVCTWYIEGDISKCFDSIDHHLLMNIIEKVILDRKFTNLIWKSLRAGYFTFNEIEFSFVGAPEGSIISPTLANIFLHELDTYVESLKETFDQRTEKYRHFLKKRKTFLYKKYVSVYRASTPFMYANSQRLLYVRYADDWIIGIRGSKEDAIELKNKIAYFLKDNLKLSLNSKKTLITHARSEKAFFLGTYISLSKIQTIRKTLFGVKIKNSRQIRLEAPIKRIISKLEKTHFVKNGRSYPKFLWMHHSLYKIVSQYNAVIRGITNYYSFVDNAGKLNTFLYYLLKGSCCMLIAAKLSLGSQHNVFKRFGKTLTVPLENTVKFVSFFKPIYFIRPWNFKINQKRPDLMNALYVKRLSPHKKK